mgnify:CR=1 FL=1|jgi:hypothetical protein
MRSCLLSDDDELEMAWSGDAHVTDQMEQPKDVVYRKSDCASDLQQVFPSRKGYRAPLLYVAPLVLSGENLHEKEFTKPVAVASYMQPTTHQSSRRPIHTWVSRYDSDPAKKHYLVTRTVCRVFVLNNQRQKDQHRLTPVSL